MKDKLLIKNITPPLGALYFGSLFQYPPYDMAPTGTTTPFFIYNSTDSTVSAIYATYLKCVNLKMSLAKVSVWDGKNRMNSH